MASAHEDRLLATRRGQCLADRVLLYTDDADDTQEQVQIKLNAMSTSLNDRAWEKATGKKSKPVAEEVSNG